MSTFTSLLVLIYFILFYTALGEGTSAGVIVLPVHAVEKNPTVGSSRRRDNVPVAKVFNGSQYVVSISIGDPSQPVVLEVDVNSGWSWVNPTCANVDEKEEEKEYCEKNPRYDPESSKSFSFLKGSAGLSIVSRITNETMMEGTLVTDTFTLGSNSVKDQLFTLANWSKNMSVGALALGPWDSSESMVKSLPGEAFSLSLHSADKEGALIFGGIDAKKYKCGLERISISPNATIKYRNGKVVNNLVYDLPLTKIGLTIDGASSILDRKVWNKWSDKYPNGLPVVLDSTYLFSTLPHDVFLDIGKKFPGVQYVDSKLRGGLGSIYAVPCKAPDGSLDLTFGKVKISVPWSEFIVDAGNKYCYLTILSGGTEQGYPELSLGIPFFRAAYLVFHQKHKEIWLGQADDCGSNIVPIGDDGSVPVVDGCHCEAHERKQKSSASEASPSLSTLLLIIAVFVVFEVGMN